jgi:hypothetical protein
MEVRKGIPLTAEFLREDAKQAFEKAGLTGWKAAPAEGYDSL